MKTLLLYSLLSAAMFYLGSRALITRAIWSRYPPSLARFMDCSACTGFWWGFTLGVYGCFGWIPRLAFVGSGFMEPVLSGLVMLVLTPIVAGIMQRGLDQLGSAVEE